VWGAQIQFRHAVQDWVKSVNFAHSLRGWVRLTVSLVYLVVRRVLQLAALRFRSSEFKELEIVVLRHELRVSCVAKLDGLS
jgi:hypothetical protein